MSDYDRLADFLSAQKGDQWHATFAEVERVIGRPLPPSATKYPAWWANQSGTGHSQTVGWRSVGWKTTALDLPGRRVRFVRERTQHHGDTGDAAPVRSIVDALWARAELLTGIRDRAAIERLALEALIARETAAQLTALGGSMPDYETPLRERP